MGGEFTPLETEFTANKAGVDYYEGVMFTVFDGRVHTVLSWTSYTSCREDGGGLSSVRGNAEYSAYSWVSENAFRNYSFVVTEKRLPDPDHIDVGRYYFDGMANPPGSWPAPAPTPYVRRDLDGKGNIRIHDGHTGVGENATKTGSEGCIVSPLVHEWRSLVTELYIAERPLIGITGTEVMLDRVRLANTRELAQATWTANHPANDGGWSHYIGARLWLVRPDERSEAPPTAP